MKRDELLKAIKDDLNDRQGKSKRISKRIPVECTGKVINGCTVYFVPSKDELYLRTFGNIENYEEADITDNGLQAIAEDLGVFVIEEPAPEIVRSEDLNEPKGKRFNDLLCTIATEYAEKFGYTKVKDSIWDRESDPHPFSQLTNAPLRELRFDGEPEREYGKYVPHIEVRQRFGSPRLDMYYPKEVNKGKSAFVGLEFNTDGSFSEAQVFYSPGVELFPKLLAEVQKRWEEIR